MKLSPIQKVWLEGCYLKCSLSNPKFTTKQEGPFTITEVLSPVTYKLQLPQSWKIHNMFHASLLSPYHKNEIHRRNFPSLPLDLINNKEHYKIEKIICHKGTPSQWQYLIRWKGYSTEEDSWLPEKELSAAKELLQEYKNSLCPPQSSASHYWKTHPPTTMTSLPNPHTALPYIQFVTCIYTPNSAADPFLDTAL